VAGESDHAAGGGQGPQRVLAAGVHHRAAGARVEGVPDPAHDRGTGQRGLGLAGTGIGAGQRRERIGGGRVGHGFGGGVGHGVGLLRPTGGRRRSLRRADPGFAEPQRQHGPKYGRHGDDGARDHQQAGATGWSGTRRGTEHQADSLR
jgi:hypothetical protein